ncbi:MAG: hypothetical protein NDI61_13430 [Bdellovibrionaceae bacterium]|nr:hypothetical protein [Pseudobdellovibrionaceae bacterium]
MIKMTAILSVMLITSTALASGESLRCKNKIIGLAIEIKTAAKSQIRETEDKMDTQLNLLEDSTVDEVTRKKNSAAQAILDAVRELQRNVGVELPPALKRLCDNKLDWEKTISE